MPSIYDMLKSPVSVGPIDEELSRAMKIAVDLMGKPSDDENTTWLLVVPADFDEWPEEKRLKYINEKLGDCD